MTTGPLLEIARSEALNGVVPPTDAADPEWEYAPLRISSEAGRLSVAAQLALHAEFGGWELARVVRYLDGSRRVTLRRRRRRGQDALPLPVLSV